MKRIWTTLFSWDCSKMKIIWPWRSFATKLFHDHMEYHQYHTMKDNHDKSWQNTWALLKVSFNVFGLLKKCEILPSVPIQEMLQKQRTDNISAHIFFSPSQLDASFYWIHMSIEHLLLAFCLDVVFGRFTRESPAAHS